MSSIFFVDFYSSRGKKKTLSVRHDYLRDGGPTHGALRELRGAPDARRPMAAREEDGVAGAVEAHGARHELLLEGLAITDAVAQGREVEGQLLEGQHATDVVW